MNALFMKKNALVAIAATATAALALGVSVSAYADNSSNVTRAALPTGKINHIMVIDLENTSFANAFGPDSKATWLNGTLVPKGQLIENYFGTSHVSQGNYIAQISGQSSTAAINNDCLDLASLKTPPLVGGFTDISPATPTADGQVIGDGCVFPNSVKTIGDQLDAVAKKRHLTNPWRMYAEDMGNDPTRDYGTVDPMGGTTCAHPAIGGVDNSNSASATDQYATRHNGFMYFHSIIDNQKNCDARVVPLGVVATGKYGYKDMFQGHLYEDLKSVKTTPAFSFVSPNLCNDAHDAKCVGPDAEGMANNTNMVAADAWLKHWIPMIMASPAYTSGQMMVVVTFDESALSDSSALPGQPSGPNQNGNPGYSPILGMFKYQTAPTAAGTYPGGGRMGALILNSKYVKAGVRNTTGQYNHYSALRSYEDLLGLTTGATDGFGHLGYAGQTGLVPFGKDVFNNYTSSHK